MKCLSSPVSNWRNLGYVHRICLIFPSLPVLYIASRHKWHNIFAQLAAEKVLQEIFLLPWNNDALVSGKEVVKKIYPLPYDIALLAKKESATECRIWCRGRHPISSVNSTLTPWDATILPFGLDG